MFFVYILKSIESRFLLPSFLIEFPFSITVYISCYTHTHTLVHGHTHVMWQGVANELVKLIGQLRSLEHMRPQTWEERTQAETHV